MAGGASPSAPIPRRQRLANLLVEGQPGLYLEFQTSLGYTVRAVYPGQSDPASILLHYLCVFVCVPVCVYVSVCISSGLCGILHELGVYINSYRHTHTHDNKKGRLGPHYFFLGAIQSQCHCYTNKNDTSHYQTKPF